MLKKLQCLIASSLIVCVFNPVYAATTADWSAEFTIGPKHDHLINHTPTRVCLDNMICGGKGIYLSAGTSINGVTIGKCALDLKTEMSKQQFVDAMKCSGLAPIEKK